jgi:hypothetical protein
MPLGIVVVSGMVFSTALTLLIVPVVYTQLARFAGAVHGATAAEEAAAMADVVPLPVAGGGAAAARGARREGD